MGRRLGRHWLLYPQANGSTLAPPSVPNVVYNAYGYDSIVVSRSDGKAFDFIGADFAGAGLWTAAAEITVTGYNGSTKVDSVTESLKTDQYVWLNANLKGVTSLAFGNGAPSGGRWWWMDNFTYNESAGSVPDGGLTFGMLGVAVTGLAWVRRKQS